MTNNLMLKLKGYGSLKQLLTFMCWAGNNLF